MERTCLTCGIAKPLTAFWIDSEAGKAHPLPPAKHCIECHDAGLVPHGYGPGTWASPRALDEWMGKINTIR